MWLQMVAPVASGAVKGMFTARMKRTVFVYSPSSSGFGGLYSVGGCARLDYFYTSLLSDSFEP